MPGAIWMHVSMRGGLLDWLSFRGPSGGTTPRGCSWLLLAAAGRCCSLATSVSRRGHFGAAGYLLLWLGYRFLDPFASGKDMPRGRRRGLLDLGPSRADLGSFGGPSWGSFSAIL